MVKPKEDPMDAAKGRVGTTGNPPPASPVTTPRTAAAGGSPPPVAGAAQPPGDEFYPAPESVMREAGYLLAYRTGGQPFDRQRTLHAALNVAGWLNARIPAAEAAQAPKRGGPHEDETPDLDEGLKALAHPAPEGTQAGLFGGGGGAWAALLKQILTEIVLKLLAG
jgi:hypothetical protein